MNNIQQEYWLKTKRTIQSTVGEDDILWYQSDYVEWLEKELAASRDSRLLSAVPPLNVDKEHLMDKIYNIIENFDIQINDGEPTAEGVEIQRIAEQIYDLVRRH